MSKKKSKPKKLGYSVVRKIIFINGKQKKIKVEYIDGIPIADWIDRNADEIYNLNNGNYHLLDQDHNSINHRSVSVVQSIGVNDEPPF